MFKAIKARNEERVNIKYEHTILTFMQLTHRGKFIYIYIYACMYEFC